MIPNVAPKGRSFKGVVAYIIHDPGQATSNDRVMFTHTHNMRTDDAEKAAKVMAYTALHADELKKASNVAKTGRKSDKPVYHLSLSWTPEEDPDQAEMIAAGNAALQEIGLLDHEAVFAAHSDKGHTHLHIVVNRINPINGKTVNNKDDWKTLQSWAHQYDKARGLEHRTPERAKKYDKLFELAANDNVKKSESREQWQSQQGVLYPKSKLFQELKEKFSARARALAKSGAEMRKQHRDERAELKIRQAQERVQLGQRQTQSVKHRSAFAHAATSGKFLSWKDHQVEKTSLRQEHADQLLELKAKQKQNNETVVQRFKEKQKAEWRDFYRLNKADARGQLKKALDITMATKVSHHTPEYRNHLARMFNEVVDQGTRQAQFGARINADRKEFYEQLAAQNAPAIAALKLRQLKETREVRHSFGQAQQQSKARGVQIEGHRASRRQERAQMLVRHGDERAATTAKHAGERTDYARAWADLNQERKQAFAEYHESRVRQDQERARETPREKRDIFSERKVASSDYVSRDTGRSAGGGREIKGPR